MKKFDYYIEYSFLLHKMPRTAKECKTQLNALHDMDDRYWSEYHVNDKYRNVKNSKRRERLVKTYWAFKGYAV